MNRFGKIDKNAPINSVIIIMIIIILIIIIIIIIISSSSIIIIIIIITMYLVVQSWDNRYGLLDLKPSINQ